MVIAVFTVRVVRFLVLLVGHVIGNASEIVLAILVLFVHVLVWRVEVFVHLAVGHFMIITLKVFHKLLEVGHGRLDVAFVFVVEIFAWRRIVTLERIDTVPGVTVHVVRLVHMVDVRVHIRWNIVRMFVIMRSEGCGLDIQATCGTWFIAHQSIVNGLVLEVPTCMRWFAIAERWETVHERRVSTRLAAVRVGWLEQRHCLVLLWLVDQRLHWTVHGTVHQIASKVVGC